MFIRKKGNCYYLVESRRECGRVKQKIVAYIGTRPTIAEAIEHKEKRAEELRKRLAEDYDERTYRCLFGGRRGKQVERELASYSRAYSRQQHKARTGDYPDDIVRDALAVIRGEKTLQECNGKQKYPNRYRPSVVYAPFEQPRIMYMFRRYWEASEKHFQDLQRELESVERVISVLQVGKGERPKRKMDYG